jgi:hypothetical protein
MPTGDPLILGKDNDADQLTRITRNTPGAKNVNTLWAIAVNKTSFGLRGDAPKSGGGAGVFGNSQTNGEGVFGVSSTGVGVHGVGDSESGIGVYGEGKTDAFGVYARSKNNYAVSALSDIAGAYAEGKIVGVHAKATEPVSIALLAEASSNAALAGHFRGRVYVNGDLDVSGAKGAAVPFPDGTRRRLYSLESPESWFEDFGEAELIKGKAEVKLRRDFTAIVRGEYHVFLTPYGDSNGLYVQARRRGAFVVREQAGGTSRLKFSYRVVVHRKDIAAPRLPKIAPRLPVGLPKRKRPHA